MEKKLIFYIVMFITILIFISGCTVEIISKSNNVTKAGSLEKEKTTKEPLSNKIAVEKTIIDKTSPTQNVGKETIPNKTQTITQPSGTCGDGHCDISETNADCQNDCNLDNIPYSFLAVHFEMDPNCIESNKPCAGDYGNNVLARDVWQNMVTMVKLANQYNTKLTIMFWPGSAEYALDSPERIALVREWQAQGHEIGIHDQGCYEDGVCYGSAGCHLESNNLLYEQLAGNYTIKAGTPSCSSTVISTFKYMMGGRPDGRSAVAFKYDLVPGHEIYRLNGKAGYSDGTSIKIAQYNTLNPDEIYGFVDHGEGDAGNLGGSKELREWLEFLYEKDPEGNKRLTLSNLMEEYILPNNLVASVTDVCSSTDSRTQQCLQLDRFTLKSNSANCINPSDSGAFNFGRCLRTGTYCELEQGLSQEQLCSISQGDYYTYVPTSCVVANISDYEQVNCASGDLKNTQAQNTEKKTATTETQTTKTGFWNNIWCMMSNLLGIDDYPKCIASSSSVSPSAQIKNQTSNAQTQKTTQTNQQPNKTQTAKPTAVLYQQNPSENLIDYSDSPFGAYGWIIPAPNAVEFDCSKHSCNTYTPYLCFGLPDNAVLNDIGIKWLHFPTAVAVPYYNPAFRLDEEISFYNDNFNDYFFSVELTIPGANEWFNLMDYYNNIKQSAHDLNINYYAINDEIIAGTGGVFNMTPEKFAIYTRIAYRAIKDTNPNAKIMTAGPGGYSTGIEEYYMPGTQSRELSGKGGSENVDFFVRYLDALDYLEQIEKEQVNYDGRYDSYISLAERNFLFQPDNYEKYMEIHHYSHFDQKLEDVRTTTEILAETIRNLFDSKGYPDVKLWITQAGIPSGMCDVCVKGTNEKTQAIYVLEKHIISVLAGIERIYWAGQVDYLWIDDGPEGYFAYTGIAYAGLRGGQNDPAGGKKLSYYSYKIMVEKLDGSDWNNIQTISRLPNNVYAYKFINKNTGKITYVSWWDYWNEPTLTTKQVTIPISGIANAKITEAVPKYESGLHVTDYSNAFNTGEKQVTNGQITFDLGQSPVYIEETTENLRDYIPHAWQQTTSTTNIQTKTNTNKTSSYCGNNICDSGEDAKSCQQDCNVPITKGTNSCGDGYCDGLLGEKSTCLQDCIITK